MRRLTAYPETCYGSGVIGFYIAMPKYFQTCSTNAINNIQFKDEK
ncbi:MAG: hypothetical protein ACTS7E_01135 [Arsenophonus sp. NC-CH8-MAG3]